MNLYQQTIKNEVSLAGVGLHTGQEVTLTFKPAPAFHGVKFKRVDTAEQTIIPADCDLVISVERGTTLEKNGVKVATVEHLMAAVFGLQIDNLLIETNGVEIPILDGSSLPFIKALKQAGIVEQQEEREIFELNETISFKDAEKDVEMLAMPSSDYKVTALIDYQSKILGQQHSSLDKLEDFEKDFSEARTFCFLHELEYLYESGLIRGGDLNNAIVVVDKPVGDDELGKLRKIFNKPDVAVAEGILNNVDLRYPNEPARHKLLDVIGDLALIGTPVRANFIATKPGHKTNVEFAKKIKAAIKKQKKTPNVPTYDPNAEPVFDLPAIQKLLPHRSPFLLIDKIVSLTDKEVIGIKNVTFNEPFFQGHFPGNPVMPGVLQVEAMAQTGGILALNAVEDPDSEYDTYFLKINNCRFKHMVKPGDTLVLKLELLSPMRRGILEMKGTAFVGNKIATEAELMAKIQKKKLIMHQPLSYVHPQAELADNVVVEPFVTIHKDVVIEEGTWIGPHVTIMQGARIGKNCKIFPGSVISAVPQDLKYKGEKTTVEIGDNVTIREFVTINKGTEYSGTTKIGSNTLLMAYVHIAHDCIIGDNVILANNTNLAGHVEIDDWAILGGSVNVQQFTKIGKHAFISGGGGVNKDVPPYVKAARLPVSYIGVNSVGMRRRGFDSKTINSILEIYRILFVRGYNTSNAMKIIEAEIEDSPEKDEITTFVRNSVRGVMKGFATNNDR